MPKGYIDRNCETCGAPFKGNRLRCKACLSEVPRKMFKYRIYPNQAETAKLEWTLDKCRRLYNAALSGRQYSRVVPLDPITGEVISKMRYSLTHDYESLYTPIAILHEPVATSKGDQSKEFTEIKRTILPEYQEIGDHILRDVLERADLAFQAFFKRNKEGVGYPKFKGQKWYNSFASDSGYKFIPRENPKRGTLYLQNIGDIKIQLHRPLEGKIKKYLIIREEDQWFVYFSCELTASKEKLPISYEDIGIDVGIAQFAALSDGSFIENPRYYRKAEENLAKLQQSLSRKKKKGVQGSNGSRRKKAIVKVTKAHRKIRNQRKDFLHKTSRMLVNRYQVIVHEDLKIKNMSKRPKPKQDEETGQYLPNNASAKAGLNKSILDASWGTFTSMIEAKAKGAGRIVKSVPAMFTSQTCSACGHCEKDNREDQATFICKSCGYTNNADTNAAINILRKNQEL